MRWTYGTPTASRPRRCLPRWRKRSPPPTASPTTAAPPWPARRRGRSTRRQAARCRCARCGYCVSAQAAAVPSAAQHFSSSLPERAALAGGDGMSFTCAVMALAKTHMPLRDIHCEAAVQIHHARCPRPHETPTWCATRWPRRQRPQRPRSAARLPLRPRMAAARPWIRYRALRQARPAGAGFSMRLDSPVWMCRHPVRLTAKGRCRCRRKSVSLRKAGLHDAGRSHASHARGPRSSRTDATSPEAAQAAARRARARPRRRRARAPAPAARRARQARRPRRRPAAARGRAPRGPPPRRAPQPGPRQARAPLLRSHLARRPRVATRSAACGARRRPPSPSPRLRPRRARPRSRRARPRAARAGAGARVRRRLRAPSRPRSARWTPTPRWACSRCALFF